MKGRLDIEQNTWNYIREFFELRENLKMDLQQNNSSLAVNLDDVESKIYKLLVPPVSAIVWRVAQNQVPEDIRREIVNGAIEKLFNTYSSFQGKGKLSGYFATIVKNFTLDALRKRQADRPLEFHDDENLRQASDAQIARAYTGKAEADTPAEIPLDFMSHIFDLVRFEEQHLTDNELAAVTIKLECVVRKEKIPDTEAARRLGIPYTTYKDALRRAMDKIGRYWKEKQGHES